jgi:hypothetical protein
MLQQAQSREQIVALLTQHPQTVSGETRGKLGRRVLERTQGRCPRRVIRKSRLWVPMVTSTIQTAD